MFLLGILLFLIPTLNFGMNYGWNNYPHYGYANGGYGYGGYGNQPYPGYYYPQHQPYGYTSSSGGIVKAFRNYIYPAYYYMPSLGRLLKSGAYGALKGAGAGAAIGGIVGLIG
uniref:Uncharacterized protein n=1 Tax=Elaeophora elaphi TaxID=1147741 RepID=A0A0R3RWL2_9BILA